MTRLFTGVDLIEINRLEQLPQGVRQKFCQRVYTPVELAESHDLSQSLAGKFAAKEAVAKALGCGIGPLRWQDIEVYKGSQGQPLLRLYGAALDFSTQLKITEWSLSISHTGSYAVAFVVALAEDREN